MNYEAKVSDLYHATRELSRRKHLWFMRYCWQRDKTTDPLVVGHHTETICNRLDKAIRDYRDGQSTFLMIKLPFRHGKLISDDTPVLTPAGWRRHGDLHPGDMVFGRDGSRKIVIAESAPGEANRIVKFGDGGEVICHENHEWVVWDRGRHCERVVETKEIEATLSDSSGRFRYLVDHNAALDFSEKNLPIHPYVLGAWLGDGSTTKNCITYGESKRCVIEHIESLGYTEKKVCIHNQTNVETAYFYKLYRDLVDCGLLGKEKFIPEGYLTSSVEHRVQLLAGLVDTDGYVDKTGRICFSNTNENLVDGVVQLVRSLGSRVSVCKFPPVLSSSGIQGVKPVYQVRFLLTRKIPTVRLKIDRFGSANRRRSIVSVMHCDPEPGKCIQVDGGVYLAGKTCVPTHNSDIVSRYFPPHFLGHFPDNEVIVAGYSASLTAEFSKFARRLVKSDEFLELYPEVQLSKDEQSVDVWGIEKRLGKAHWVGLGGSLTGKGSSCLIIDDFFKGREEAESEVIRDKVWDSFANDAMTRRAPVCIVIVLATPWHTDDLFGRIKKKMDEDPQFPRFEEMKFPAKDEKYLEINKSEYLFPERFDSDWYEGQFSTLGPYASAALLQCDPVVRHGNLLRIDRVQFYDEPPQNLRWTRGWDLASSEQQRVKDDPDYTASIKLGVNWIANSTGNPMPVLYIDDFTCNRFTAPKRDARIKAVADADGPTVPIGIEAYGPYKDAFTNLETALWGIRSVIKVQLPGDKVTRASVLEPAFDAGNIYMRKAPWNAELLQFLGEFPGGSHDDPVDALVTAFALHKPYVKHVFSNMATLKTIPFQIHWGKKDERNSLHYGSIIMRKDLSMYALATLWDDVAGQFFVYDCAEFEEPDVQKACFWMTNHMHLKQFKIDRIVCNDRMCEAKEAEKDMRQLFRDEFQKIKVMARINEAVKYDQWGAIAQVNQLVADKRMFINETCEEALNQFNSWSVDNNKPSQDNCGYCEALCLVVSELRRRVVFERRMPILRDYVRKEVLDKAISNDPILSGKGM